MKAIVFLTPPDARYGFRLTGVLQKEAVSDEAESELRHWLGDAGTGVVVIDERLFRHISESRVGDMERRWPGKIVVLPAPKRVETVEEDYLLRMVRKAIGYQVKLNL